MLFRSPGNITRKAAFVQSRLTRMLHMQEQNLIPDKAESRRVHMFSVSVALVKGQNELILSPSILYAFRFEQHFARRSGMTRTKPKICIHDNLLSKGSQRGTDTPNHTPFLLDVKPFHKFFFRPAMRTRSPCTHAPALLRDPRPGEGQKDTG